MTDRAFSGIGWMTALALLSLFAADRYASAAADSSGALQIKTTGGRTIRIPKKPKQDSFDDIQVAADGTALGWAEEYPNCCTSYPIPLTLVIYTDGHPREFKGSGLPIFKWHFTPDSRQFAFEQETVHGSFGVHYELHDVATGRRLDEFTPPVDPDGRSLTPANPPRWVAELDAAKSGLQLGRPSLPRD